MNKIFLMSIVLIFNHASGCDLDHCIHINTLLKTTKDWMGNALPSYPNGKPEITILEITIEPKTKLPWHYHPYINAGVVVSGTLKVATKSGTTKILKAGEAMTELVDLLHYGENIGDDVVKLYVFYVAEEDQPTTILEK